MKLGSKDIKKMFLGSKNVARCCLGEEEVYYGYQIVEYIKNNSVGGGLNTGMKNSITDYSIETKFKQDEVSTGMVLGTQASDAGMLWLRNGPANGSFIVYALSQTVNVETWTPVDTNIHTIKFEGQQDHCTISWDEGNTTTVNYENPQQYSTDNLYIFGRRASSAWYIGRIYYVKVWNTSTQELLIDYVPCYRKSDNTPGFWDRVTKTFKTIADASTKWEVGPDVD